MSTSSDHQQGITAFWDDRASAYDAQPSHGISSQTEHEAWLAALRKLLPPAPADILDVGTGTGFLAFLVAELGHRSTGVDLSDRMLAEGRAKVAAMPDDQRPTLLVGDAHEPPLPPASQDTIVSRHVLWTLAEPARALANWQTLLRPGGTLVIIDGLWSQGQDPDTNDRVQQMEPAARERWERAYGPAVRDGLPMMLAQTMEPITSAVEAAGFVEIQITHLEDVERAEHAANSGREHVTPRYVVTARRPA
jgi:ubiquinone/menaquinone biosynthesis C-methylase UbiE